MVSEGKRWALVGGSQSTLSSADESLAGGIGPLRFGRGLAWPGRACGIGRGLGKAALGCGGLRWAVALDLLGARDQAASLRGVSGGRSGVRGGLRQPLVWNGVPGLCGVGQCAAPGSCPGRARLVHCHLCVCSAVLGAPMPFPCWESLPVGLPWSPGLPWPHSPLPRAAPVTEF